METIYDKVKTFLIENPRARERKYKDEAIVYMLASKYPYFRGLTKESAIAFVQAYSSYDRAWRNVLQDCESLRGKDYNKGKLLAQEKILELGYEPGTRKLNI